MSNCQFRGKTPCNNCPYRKDAPLRLWAIEEFEQLLEYEKDFLGAVYGCHKKDGSVCRGWLIDQDNRDFPSIRLRLALRKAEITREYLDSLHSQTPLYESVEDMIFANFPELLLKP